MPESRKYHVTLFELFRFEYALRQRPEYYVSGAMTHGEVAIKSFFGTVQLTHSFDERTCELAITILAKPERLPAAMIFSMIEQGIAAVREQPAPDAGKLLSGLKDAYQAAQHDEVRAKSALLECATKAETQ
jgi:hypothetical protein